jgi:hypothetical protein
MPLKESHPLANPTRGSFTCQLYFPMLGSPDVIASTAIYAKLPLGYLWAFDFKRRPRRRKGRTSRP